MRFLLIISFVIYTSALDVNRLNVSISPSTARLTAGNSIRIVLLTSPPTLFNGCRLRLPNNVEYNSNADIVLGDDVSDRMQWLPAGECGVIVSNASRFVHGTITLIGQIDQEYSMNSILTISDRPPSKQVINLQLGSFLRIDCDVGTLRPNYCRIVDNKGKVASESCTFNVRLTKEHIGTWTCKMGIIGSLKEVTHEIDVNLQPSESIIGLHTKTDSSISMECLLKDSNLRISWCRALKPDGSRLLLSDGMISDRYDAFETDLTAGRCRLNIKLPLDSSDNGIWRIDLGISASDYTGCYFKIPENHSSAPPMQNRSLTIQRQSNYEMECTVPWPIKYCYVKRPDGHTIHNIFSLTSERLQNVGICRVNLINVTMSGAWSCVVSSENSREDTTFITNVEVSDDNVITEVDERRNYFGKTASLKCKTVFEEPLDYCLFISPQGNGFNLESNAKLNNRYEYEAKGLEFGECGMRIRLIRKEDEGLWKCVISTNNPLIKNVMREMYIGGAEPGSAFIITMTMVCIIMGTLIAIFAWIKWKQRRRNESILNNRPRQQPDNDSL